MRFLVFAVFLVVLHIDFGYCFNTDNVRVKRSNETEGISLKKVTDGFKSFGNKVSNVATKGYEEFKNLFSKDRKVGDYQLNNIDVRVRDEEDYEEVSVKRPKRDTRKQKVEMMRVNLRELVGALNDMRVLKTTTQRGPGSLNIPMKAETDDDKQPIYHSVLVIPPVCPHGKTYIDGRCRMIS